MITIAFLCAAALLAAVLFAAAARALVREFRQQARAERQDAADPLVKAALAVIADEAEDDAWWLEDGEQRLPAALAVAHVAGACEQTNSDLWAGWPSGAFRAAMEQGDVT